MDLDKKSVARVLIGFVQSDGMDAPLHNGIKRAKVVVSASHFEEERPR